MDMEVVKDLENYIYFIFSTGFLFGFSLKLLPRKGREKKCVRKSRPEESAYQSEAAICQHRQ